MCKEQKQQLIIKIEKLMCAGSVPISINKNYLKYFTYEELKDIETQLQTKKDQNNDKDYIEQIANTLTN